MGITRIRGPLENYCLISKVNALIDANKLVGTYLPQGQAPRFPLDWLKISGSPRYPTMIGWTTCGRVQWESCAMVTHPSTNLA